MAKVKVNNNNGGGGGGSTTWGSITGDINTQADLIAKFGTTIKKSSNQPSTVVALADLTDFSFNVENGKSYYIYMLGMYQTAATTTGIKIGVYLSGGGAGTIGGAFSGTISAVAAATELKIPCRAIGVSNLAGSNITTTGVSAINTPHTIGLEAYFHCTSSGVFKFEMASEVAGSSAQFNSGSILMIQEI